MTNQTGERLARQAEEIKRLERVVRELNLRAVELKGAELAYTAGWNARGEVEAAAAGYQLGMFASDKACEVYVEQVEGRDG